MRKIITDSINTDIEPLRRLLKSIGQNEKTTEATGLTGAARSFLVALLYERAEKSLLVICPEEKEAAAFARDLTLFLGEEEVLYYPPLDFLAVDMFTLQKEEALARLEVLAALQITPRAVVVAPLAAVAQKVMPFSEFQNYLQIISTGDSLPREEFCRKLIAGGYKNVGLVEEKGEFSLRGSIIDVFSPAEKNPVRMELFGDEV
ncbi:MAG TPA: hypothetical protein PKZ12_00540, partial [Smithellaceae bacterium]|nr:hypothetical protein [Smithellaceae bacterium]